MGEGVNAVDGIELRVAEVQRSVDVGMAEIKGSLAVLVQAGDHAKQAITDLDLRIKAEFDRRDKADADQERRLRSVERKAYMVSGAAGAISLAVLIAHFVH